MKLLTCRGMRAVLVVVLDTLVAGGWPDARGIAYRLREIFR